MEDIPQTTVVEIVPESYRHLIVLQLPRRIWWIDGWCFQADHAIKVTVDVVEGFAGQTQAARLDGTEKAEDSEEELIWEVSDGEDFGS